MGKAKTGLGKAIGNLVEAAEKVVKAVKELQTELDKKQPPEE